MNSNEPMPIGKGIVMTLIVIVAVAIIVVVTGMAGIPMWVLFLGLCVWMATGTDMTFKGTSRVWLGAGMGLAIGFLMPLASTGQMWALAIAAALLLALLFCMTTGRLPLIFNMSTGIFTTVATIGFGITVETFISWIVGYLLIGVLPVVVVGLLAKKKEKATSEEVVPQ